LDSQSVHVLANLIDAADFYLIPIGKSLEEYDLEVFKGDSYAYSSVGSSSAGPNTWSHSLRLLSGNYTLVVRSVYDVRQFGGVDKVPKAKFKFEIGIPKWKPYELVTVKGSEIVPDVVGGWIMGEGLGIGVRFFGEDGKLVIKSVKVIDVSFRRMMQYPSSRSLSL
jgi:hypothetical protein